MKILAFVDTHEDPRVWSRFKRIIKREKIDLVCCMGDFTIFGRKTTEGINQLDSLGVPVVLIHGNHEDPDEVLELLDTTKNIHWAHEQVVDINGVRFIGFGGHGFRQEEPELEELEARLANKFSRTTIIMSHAPPYETTLDEVEEEWHVGNESLRRLIMRRRPMLVLCGHIHQCFHAHDTIGKTTCINPGPDGEIIEVDV